MSESEQPISFDIGGVSYQARRMGLFPQIAITVKLAPLMANGMAHILRMFQMVDDPADANLPADERGRRSLARVFALPKDLLLEQAVPLAAELAKMPEADQRFIIMNTLSTVLVNRGTAISPQWAYVWPAGLPEAAFPEYRTNLMLVLRIVGTVLAANLGPFTPGSR
jgi:hypothetical protein